MTGNIITQPRNVENDIKATLDSYESKIDHEFWLAEALQKDAVQNSWDAKISKEKWLCRFSLIQLDGKKFLTIVDEGTRGLAGRFFKNYEELQTILGNPEAQEDLAYFCSSNWSGKSVEEGGTRGRGKVLFLGASEEKRIFFDSLRSSDSQYVMGTVYLDNDKNVKIIPYYDDEAIGELTKLGNIEPLKTAGTRILIPTPKNEVIKAITNGDFLSFINHTWWEIIKKYDAKIFVHDGTEERQAIIPKWYENDVQDIKEQAGKSELIKRGTAYEIKRLVLRYSPNNSVPESVKGIAIQRGGMTVQRLPAESLINEAGMTNVYGWAELGKKENMELEKDMKVKCEGPEHLEFSWHKNPAKMLKEYIIRQLRTFAKDIKLTESVEEQKNKIQRGAEAKALRNLTNLFKKLKLSGKHTGDRNREASSRKENEPLRLSVVDFKLPQENTRVDFGEKIKGAYVEPINDLRESIMVLVRTYIVSADGKNTKVIEEREINLRPGHGPKIGKEIIEIKKEDFNKGAYSFKARMYSLEEKGEKFLNGMQIEKGQILYERVNKRFYIQEDPPEFGPFHFQPEQKDDKKRLLSWEAADDGYVIYYNERHPKIKPLLSDVEKLSNYLTEQAALLAFQIKLEDLIANDDNTDSELAKIIKTKNLNKVFPTLLGRYSEYLWDYLNN